MLFEETDFAILKIKVAEIKTVSTISTENISLSEPFAMQLSSIVHNRL